jgi:excinuclease ABC subunit A
LRERLGIRPLDELEGLDIYGHEDRVWVTNHKGPWQSVTAKVFRMSEVDTPAFRKFLAEAAASYFTTLKRMQTKPEDVMPWKINGERWHLGPKGFPPRKKLQWDVGILPRLLQLLRELEPGLEISWDVQYFITLRVPGIGRAWGQIQTKRAHGLVCRFTGKKGQFNLARIEGLGTTPRIDTEREELDAVWLTLLQLDPSLAAKLKKLLGEHLNGFREVFARS